MIICSATTVGTLLPRPARDLSIKEIDFLCSPRVFSRDLSRRREKNIRAFDSSMKIPSTPSRVSIIGAGEERGVGVINDRDPVCVYDDRPGFHETAAYACCRSLWLIRVLRSPNSFATRRDSDLSLEKSPSRRRIVLLGYVHLKARYSIASNRTPCFANAKRHSLLIISATVQSETKSSLPPPRIPRYARRPRRARVSVRELVHAYAWNDLRALDSDPIPPYNSETGDKSDSPGSFLPPPPYLCPPVSVSLRVALSFSLSRARK